MYFLGLHILDLSAIAVYVIVVLWIGRVFSKKIKDQDDFFLAGRKLGKVIQFFLNFGNMVELLGAASVTAIVFKNGIGGIWLGFQMLLITPYYWFMNQRFRRVRLVTMAELFEDRFGGQSLSILYAVVALVMAPIGIGLLNLVSYKTMDAMLLKAPAAYSAQETQMVQEYQEYTELGQLYATGQLTSTDQQQRYAVLKSLYLRGKIKSYVSYVNPVVFYICYGIIVGGYVVLGGFAAAAITDAIQGFLIMIFSLILIPFGLIKLGGFSGLHSAVPDHMFDLWKSSATGEFTWHSIFAITIIALISINGIGGNMPISGSARDEFAARFGAVTGGFAKRLITIGWALCGLIAVGLFSQNISDPDTAWGVLSNNLLVPGAIGLMLAGILAANMSTLDAASLVLSALFVRNLYMYVAPGKSEKHYILIGRVAVIGVIAVGILVALYATGVIDLIKFIGPVGVTFGAPVLLLFYWRRLTQTAVITQVALCIVILLILPWMIPFLGGDVNPALTVTTYAQVIEITKKATADDVDNGRADTAGQRIRENRILEPISVYFDSVAHVDPYDVASPVKGEGPFKIELYILNQLGLDVRSLSPAGLITARWLFASILPFLLLFGVSYVTKVPEKRLIDKFYVKMKTRVLPDREADDRELAKSYENPHRFNHLKIFPRSHWEFCKWNKADSIGFVICGMVVFAMIGILWVVVNIGRE